MKSSIKVSGIAAAVASLVATGAANLVGHQVDGATSIAMAEKSCADKKGCPHQGKKSEHEKVENEHKE